MPPKRIMQQMNNKKKIPLFENEVIFLLLIFDKPGERTALVHQTNLVTGTTICSKNEFQGIRRKQIPLTRNNARHDLILR